jgi:anti-sigma regulatory factor (Ser/Thr protein kinase)
MDTLLGLRPTVRRPRRTSLTARPTAAAEARSRVRAAIHAWDVPVDPDIAVVLTSELVTNALRHEAGETITLTITCVCDQLRVDVHDSSSCTPVLEEAPADAEAGRGLMLVASLSAEWGFYRTPAGKAVYFTLLPRADADGGDDPSPQVFARGSGESSPPPGFTGPAPCAIILAPRLFGRDGPQRCLAGDVYARIDLELLQDAGDVGRNGAPG